MERVILDPYIVDTTLKSVDLEWLIAAGIDKSQRNKKKKRGCMSKTFQCSERICSLVS